MSDWSSRVAPEAASRLAYDANDGAQFLSQQIQSMQQSGNGREALELVRKTREIESRMPISQYGGVIETNHMQANNGWIYENVAVNGQRIAAIPERPCNYAEGQPLREGIRIPEIALGVGIGIIAGNLFRGHERDRDRHDYYEHRERQNYYSRPRWP